MPAAGRGPFPVPDAIVHTLHDTRLRRWGYPYREKTKIVQIYVPPHLPSSRKKATIAK